MIRGLAGLRGFLRAAVLAAVWAAATPVLGQDESALPDRAALEQRLETWSAEAEPLLGAEAPEAVAAASAVRLVEAHLEAEARATAIAEAAEAAVQELEDGPSSSVGSPPPYDFATFDGVLDRRQVQGDAERLANEAIDAAVRELEEAETAARAAGDLGDAGGWSRRAAEARVELARRHLQNARKEQETARCRYDLAKQVASFVSDRLDARPSGLAERLGAIDEQRLVLEGRGPQLQREIELAESRWLGARGRLEGLETDEARSEKAARKAALDSADRIQSWHVARLQRLDLEADMWRHRFRAAADGDEIEEPELDLNQLAKAMDRQQREHELVMQQLGTERRTLEEGAGGAVEGRWPRKYLETLSSTLREGDVELADIRRVKTLLERVQAECSLPAVRLGALAGDVWQSLVRLWHFDLLVVDDRPVTVGKTLLAILLLLIGYRVSKRLSAAVGRLLERQLHVSSGVAAALQNLALYALLVFFFLWAFQLVGIPLTVFTVLGGVVAIGLGFGSQNIVNNFISGLILLIERPIKVDDLIEVGGVLGSVERIGLRSTRVRAGDNTHVIVPNSSFLEQNVLNWTVSDDVIRTEVDVGVAYGSPTDEVKRLIERALDDEPLILERPAWDVLFMDFGDNALHFRAYFWIRVHGFLDRDRVASAVRFRIDALFRDAEIEISFPQRDVHLDTVKPLEVQLLDRRP
ncbi:MAG: mechanosensitive ion channel domain-containing protein [Acidobacteriota bacterium]